jgi:hypothetical protein
MIKTAKGTKAFNTMTMLSQTLYWSTSLGFGHKEGLSVARMMMYTRYRKANVKPGMMAAAYILTTETLAVAAYTMSNMEGGIKIPKVPPAVITPAASFSS